LAEWAVGRRFGSAGRRVEAAGWRTSRIPPESEQAAGAAAGPSSLARPRWRWGRGAAAAVGEGSSSSGGGGGGGEAAASDYGGGGAAVCVAGGSGRGGAAVAGGSGGVDAGEAARRGCSEGRGRCVCGSGAPTRYLIPTLCRAPFFAVRQRAFAVRALFAVRMAAFAVRQGSLPCACARQSIFILFLPLL
jgi:hypothetical protein